MEIDKYFHMYGTKDEILFEEVEKPEQRWIPVSERMPEESGWYIVTVEDETDTHLRWFSTLHGFEWEEKDNTIAWMPLPKPYEGES